jgi:hypothetical protein
VGDAAVKEKFLIFYFSTAPDNIIRRIHAYRKEQKPIKLGGTRKTLAFSTCLAPDQPFLNLPQNVFRPEKLNIMKIILIH